MTWQEFRPRDIDDLSKDFIGLAPGDRVALSSIYKNLATDGTNIDPDGAAFRDGVIIGICIFEGSALFTMRLDPGYVGPSLSDLRTETSACFDLVLNDDGRIENLWIGMNDHTFDLPMAVGCLGQLKELAVGKRCKSISYQQLSKLPFLHYFELNSFEPLHGIENFKSSSLRKIYLTEECDIDGGMFETLMFDMLPTFPNISELWLCDNNMKVFDPCRKDSRR